MKRINVGTNFVIFLLFFGVALLEAIKEGNWLKATLWAGVGIIFLLADTLKRERGSGKPDKN